MVQNPGKKLDRILGHIIGLKISAAICVIWFVVKYWASIRSEAKLVDSRLTMNN